MLQRAPDRTLLPSPASSVSAAGTRAGAGARIWVRWATPDHIWRPGDSMTASSTGLAARAKDHAVLLTAAVRCTAASTERIR